MSQTQDPSPPTTSSDLPPLQPQPIVARGGQYYRNARFLLAALLAGFGVWCYFDGFVRWPKHNAQFAELMAKRNALADGTPEYNQINAEIQKMGEPYAELSIKLNRYLTFILPVLGAGLAAYAVRRSRGEVRLENGTFTKPGCEPVALESITAVDTALWERKGIARATYKRPDGSTGTLVLDDFIYEQKPIDAMYEHILAHLKLR